MPLEPLIIKRRGEDYHRVISIRIDKDLLRDIENAAEKAYFSRNNLIIILLRYAMKQIEIEQA